ncbi:hypothetical protein WJX74_000129 [Apatococcus lobatus]|uniref:mRNA m(6)A methyltransferase n=1 Tax=Apatococcus lobatus TaxID=904363 RepID=A0AAW1SFN1_9CHLO
MPSLNLDGRDVELEDLLPEELQAHLDHCRLLFPRWRRNYQVVLADPPWRYDTMYSGLQGVAPYPTMSFEELAALPVRDLADARGCALFLWATGPLMDRAIRLMEAWGFRCAPRDGGKRPLLLPGGLGPVERLRLGAPHDGHQHHHRPQQGLGAGRVPAGRQLLDGLAQQRADQVQVWRKTNRDGTPVCSPGWWSRSSCEFLLVGTLAGARGSVLAHKTTNSEPQEFASVRGAHSAKPREITQAVADFLDVERRLELFARLPHPQFDSWGLEVPDFFQEAGYAREPPRPSSHPRPVALARRKGDAFGHLRMRAGPVAIVKRNSSPRSIRLPPASPPIDIPDPSPAYASQEAVWRRLGELQPVAGKRKTVHKPSCACFLCGRRRAAGAREDAEEARGRGAPASTVEVRFQLCTYVCEAPPLHGLRAMVAPFERAVESMQLPLPFSPKPDPVQFQLWLASLESQVLLITADPAAGLLAARQLPLLLPLSDPAVVSVGPELEEVEDAADVVAEGDAAAAATACAGVCTSTEVAEGTGAASTAPPAAADTAGVPLVA